MARELVKTFKPDQPLGSVIQSLLIEEEFQAEHGNNWVLMDGRSVVGSDYQLLDPGNPSRVVIPDARGQFLRGKNHTRADAEANPDGDQPLGTQTSDAIRNITGQFGVKSQEWYVDTPTPPALSPFYDTGTFAPGITNSSGTSGESTLYGFDTSRLVPTAGDNRPKNITINYFIKINNEAT
jgi:hypothetical protein